MNTAKNVQQKMKKGHAIILIWADWCPHCINMMPAWNTVKTNLKGETEFVEIESKAFEEIQHADPDLAKRLLSGERLSYPTIVIWKGSSGKRYTDSRDVQNMKKAFASPKKKPTPKKVPAKPKATSKKSNTLRDAKKNS
jgi:thiol-disulfide isomerase/thioredoxin